MAIRRPTRRTKIVWASFGSAMTLVTGLLILAEGNADGGSDVGVPRAFVAAAPAGVEMSAGPLEPRDAAFDASRWTSIVIHHTGSPAGDPETIERQHVSNGYASLGYHFVIGNGHGFGDGAVFVGPRWNRQEPGAHVAGANGARLNEHAIGICLVGNGNRRAFTDRQIRELVTLVRALQKEAGIPAENVVLHSDVAAVSSPGRYFPVAEFESQLLP